MKGAVRLVGFAVLAGVLPAARTGSAEEAAPALRGSWLARSGAAVFRGRWTAETPTSSGDVQGSWTLLGADDEITLDGTWSARKTGRSWKGKWAARSRPGGLYSGTWDTTFTGIKGSTFFDLLAHAKTARVAGTWRMGRTSGDWWLETSP